LKQPDMGLSIAHTIIESHGGNQSEGGAIFRFRLDIGNSDR
jgi:hypothetical protein